MKGILIYFRWLWSHSVGARGAVLVNILLGSLNVGIYPWSLFKEALWLSFNKRLNNEADFLY